MTTTGDQERSNTSEVVRARKRPVEVEAMRYDGPSWVTAEGSERVWYSPEFEGIRRFISSKFATPHVGNLPHGGPRQFAPAVRTLEGLMRISPGDWVIKGVKGEFYPCKPDVFEATYEVLSSDDVGTGE